MTTCIRIGVLGCSSFAFKMIVPNLIRLHRQYRVTAISSRSIDRARTFAKSAGIESATVFNDPEALILSGAVDAVYIPLPNSFHAPFSKYALEHGVHVLVEKPLSLNADEVQTLHHLARRSNLVLVENFMFQFHPQIRKIIETISNGDIGEVRHLRSAFTIPRRPDGDVRLSRTLLGGALADVGVYPLKAAQLLFDTELAVTGAISFTPDGSEVDLSGHVGLVASGHGCSVDLTFGMMHAYQCVLEVVGSKGRVLANRIFTAPPDHAAQLIYEVDGEYRTLHVPPANQAESLLKYFHQLCIDQAYYDREMPREFDAQAGHARLVEKVSEAFRQP